MRDPIYLDYNATTPIADEVLDAMLPVLRDGWGNPSSSHVFGRRAHAAIDRSRERVAALLCCAPAEVTFTSGGTESDNAAIVGVAEALESRGRHIVTSAVEHPAVEETCVYLERRGWHVTRIGVGDAGTVDPDEVARAFTEQTTLVSIMHSNNETGAVQPIRAIAERARPRGILVHTDAAQSVGKLPVEVDELNVDLLTVAGHKLYAPKGVGALYIRRETPFTSFLHGAGHESGLRAGTENTAQIVGLGVAAELAHRERDARPEQLAALRDRLERSLVEALPGAVVHAAASPRLPNTLSIGWKGLDANRLVAGLDGVATAAGAACHAGVAEPSRVLRAMGVPDDVATGTLRVTVGRPTTQQEIDRAAELLIARTGGLIAG